MDLDLKKKIDDLSFGNNKKVGIIQCLLHEPKLIILDEPTSGLDPLLQHKFFNLLLEENCKSATILLSSHVLSEVQKLCDRVAIIKEGKIFKLETMSNLTENNYKKFKSVVVDINQNATWLRYFTPFKYFDVETLVTGGTLDPLFVGLSTLIIAVLVFVTYGSYKKRDIKI